MIMENFTLKQEYRRDWGIDNFILIIIPSPFLSIFLKFRIDEKILTLTSMTYHQVSDDGGLVAKLKFQKKHTLRIKLKGNLDMHVTSLPLIRKTWNLIHCFKTMMTFKVPFPLKGKDY